MRIDHRRPLVAYMLATVACAFVLAQGLRDIPAVGPGPSFGIFADDSMTPSERADTVVDPSQFEPVPESDVVDDGGETSSGSPQLDAVDGVIDGPLFPVVAADTSDGDSPGTGGDEPVVAGSQLLAGPPDADLTGNGGDGPGTGGGGLPDPDAGSGGGVFGPPLGGGPDTGSGGDDGDGHDGGDGDGGSDDGDGDGGGAANGPVPHVFDDVKSGGHPYGQVGPPPGKGNGNDGGKGNGDNGGSKESKDKAPKDKGPKDKAPKDKAPKDKAPKDKAPKDKAPKDKAPKDKGSKARGHDKSHGHKAKAPKKIHPKHGKRGPR